MCTAREVDTENNLDVNVLGVAWNPSKIPIDCFYRENLVDVREILETENGFTAFKNVLTENGVDVLSMKGSSECPDHIFPNWFITFENKTFQIFSMLAENRRKEKTPEMIEKISKEYSLTQDLSFLEDRNIF